MASCSYSPLREQKEKVGIVKFLKRGRGGSHEVKTQSPEKGMLQVLVSQGVMRWVQ